MTTEAQQPLPEEVPRTTHSTSNGAYLKAQVTLDGGLNMRLSASQALKFKAILFRGINTMDSPPDWAHDLYAALDEVFP